MQDIHDNVGSQLVGVLSLIRSGAPHAQLETQTASALQGLRIAVDAIQPVNGNLAAVLATLRHRLQPSLTAAGVQLVWRVDDLPRMQDLTPQKIQHIQRIVMEAFSNVIQYAKASTVTVSARLVTDPAHTPPARIQVGITDDGIGLGEDASRGQGLANMQFRADALGACITIENGAGTAAGHSQQGLAITLDIPCWP
jgi:signal transduction histidine kinase